MVTERIQDIKHFEGLGIKQKPQSPSTSEQNSFCELRKQTNNKKPNPTVNHFGIFLKFVLVIEGLIPNSRE